MGAPKLTSIKLEHELFDRAKPKEAIPDGELVFTLNDVIHISDMVSRQCWRDCTNTYRAAVKDIEKKKKTKLPNVFTEWRREKIVHVLRGLLHKAANSFKEKKGIT